MKHIYSCTLALLLLATGSFESYAALNCNVELTSSTPAKLSGYRLNRRGGVFVQTVQISNTTQQSFDGPVHLVLQNLSPGITLVNSAGSSSCSGLSGSPYVELGVGNDNLFAPGEKITFVLQFDNPQKKPISFKPRLYSGAPAVSPVSGITVDPDGFPINTATQVKFTASVPYPAGGTVPTVLLEQVDQNGNFIALEGSMADDGNLSLGDEIEGDGVFSFRKTYNIAQPSQIKLRVKTTLNGQTNYSELFNIRAFAPITDSEANSINNAQTSARQLYDQLVSSKGEEQAKIEIVTYLKGQSIVQDAGISDGTIWIKYNNGMEGAILFTPPGTKGGSSSNNSSQLSLQANLSAQSSNLEVGSKKVLIMAPFLNEFGGDDDGPAAKTLFDNHNSAGCPKYDVTYLSNSQAGVGAFKALGSYGIVHISSHGDTVNGNVIILSKTSNSAQNMQTYQADLNSSPIRLLTATTATGTWLAATPEFFRWYIQSFPSNAVVFFSSCRSTRNNTMANIINQKGAKTYFGFSDYVQTTFAKQKVTHFYDKWLEDPTTLVTTGEVFNGGCDSSNPPACWNLVGANNVEAPSGNQLQDGSFESGTLGAWSAQGDGRVISQLGNFSPTDGNRMGIISTGLGFTTDSGAVSQQACIAINATTVSFDWNFSSEEFQEWCGSPYQDYFRVDLVSENGATTNLLYRNVDSLCSSTSPASFSFDRGDAWTTGWRSEAIDISGFAASNNGKPVTVRFSAGDVGDSIYDTAITLDNIKINQ
jgi:hypothetical protein